MNTKKESRKSRRVLFSAEEQRKNIQLQFFVLALVIFLISSVGFYFLIKGIEHSGTLEIVDALEKSFFQVDLEVRQLMAQEHNRAFGDYSYRNTLNSDLNEFQKTSAISNLRPKSNIPGLVGYFQIREKGGVQFPFWNRFFNLSKSSDYNDRKKLAQDIFHILQKSQLIYSGNIEAKIFKQYFSKLVAPDLGEESLSILSKVKSIPLKQLKVSEALVGKSDLPLKTIALGAKNKSLSAAKSGVAENFGGNQNQEPLIEENAIQSGEISPLGALVLDSGYILFFRSVLHGNLRYMQGFLVQQKEFLEKIIKIPNAVMRSGKNSRISIQIGEGILDVFPAPAEGSQIIYRRSLPSPLEHLQVVYSLNHFKMGRPQTLTLGVILMGLIFLCGGIYLLYRSALRQNDLLLRQANFVSAISHELRTPLTAIRMHGEMLSNNWIREPDELKKSYGYILTEAERLTRLIENVLQVASLEKGKTALTLKPLNPAQMIDLILPKVEVLCQKAGFQFRTETHGLMEGLKSEQGENLDKPLESSSGEDVANPLYYQVDSDALIQIAINLVDNAIKFSSDSEIRKIIFIAELNDRNFRFGFRDFGPGITEGQDKFIFELFARSEEERVRKTKGTGIGLALVKSLAQEMKARVWFQNENPGCTFFVEFEPEAS